MFREKFSLDEISRALAYLMAGVFLLTLSKDTAFDLIIGWSFGIFSLCLMLSVILQKQQKLFDEIHDYLILPLFIVTIARLDIAVINTHKAEFIVLGVIFPMLAVIAWVRRLPDIKIIKERFGKGWKAVLNIGVLTVYLGLIITALVLASKNKHGTPWYLLGALVCLIILIVINWKEKKLHTG